jgi:Fe-S cluster assembly protein SufD
VATLKEDVTLHTFTAEASASLAGPPWLRARRAAGYDAVASCSLPSESEEVWRYTPINTLVLDDFAPPAQDGPAPAGDQLLAALGTALGPLAGSVLVHNGRASAFTSPEPGRAGAAEFAFGQADDVPGSSVMLGSVQEGGDALVRLNDAFMPDPVFVDVPAGMQVGAPVLIVHWCDGVSAFPRTSVRAAEGSALSVVEVYAGPEGSPRSLVVPVTELAAAEGASLSYVSVQILGESAWSIARLAGRGMADSSLRTFTVGLGASYDRVRADVSVEGREARSEILSAYLGDGTQVHDVRTLQDHVAPRTTSELLCQGAVAGTSRSVYSQPQPGPRRGRACRFRAQPRHPGERRPLRSCLDGGAGRRGPALLH